MKSTTRKPTAQPKGDFSLQQTLPTFQQLLPPPVIHALALAAYGPKRFYQRLFSPLVLLWCLILQRL
ncbi:MAG: hypothetical protein EXR62_16395, partial [Chloroflexi bacterium]|nr:hypothetical protein [Chloroflexota bacterium]